MGQGIGWGGRPVPYGAISCSMELARVTWLCQSLNRVTCDCAIGYAASVSATATKVAHLNFEVCQSLCQTQNPLYIYNISTYSTSSSSNAALAHLAQGVHQTSREKTSGRLPRWGAGCPRHGVPIRSWYPPHLCHEPAFQAALRLQDVDTKGVTAAKDWHNDWHSPL